MKHFVFSVFCISIGLFSFAQQSVSTLSAMPLASDSSQSNASFRMRTPSDWAFKSRLDSIQQLVPLDYNEQVAQQIETYLKRKSQYAEMLSRSAYYFPIFEKSLRAFNIPDEIKYLAVVESALNPHAVSRVGATGLWQFMFRTAKEYGLQMDNFVDERKDPQKASLAAAAYFRKSYDQLGDWLLAIASYNCGLSNVNRAIEKSGSRNFWDLQPFLPTETRNYVPAFIAAVYVMKYSSLHKIEANVPLFTFKVDSIDVRHFVSLSDVARAIHYTEETLFALNPSFRKNIINGTSQQPKTIVLPKVEPYFYSALFPILNSDMPIDKTVVELNLDDIYWEQNKRSQQRRAKVETLIHKVQAGQTLTQIAKQYKVSIDDIKTWNKLDTTDLYVGQLLKVVADTTAG